MAVPIHLYEEISHGGRNQLVRQEYDALDADPDRAVRAGVRDCVAHLLSCAKLTAYAPMLQPLTPVATLYHYIDGLSAKTSVLFGVAGDQRRAMTKIVAFKFALTYSAQVHNADIQTALTRFHSYSGIWL